MKDRKSTIVTLIIIAFGVLLVYIREQLGDVAALCFLFYLLGIATAVVCVALGGRLNDQGQHAFIQGMAQLKSVLAPSVREDARTRGALDRASIHILTKGAASVKEPTEVDMETQAFYRKYRKTQPTE